MFSIISFLIELCSHIDGGTQSFYRLGLYFYINNYTMSEIFAMKREILLWFISKIFYVVITSIFMRPLMFLCLFIYLIVTNDSL